jgi:hypothetical protein
MKKIILLTLLFGFSSCRYQQHDVRILPWTTQINQSKFEESAQKNIALRFVDGRKYKDFIGFRTRASIWYLKEKYKEPDFFVKQGDFYFKIAELNNKSDFINIFSRKFSQNVVNKNLQVRNYSANLMTVEIEELSVVSSMYRNFVNSKIKVSVSTRYGMVNKTYKQEIISYKPMVLAIILGPLDFGMSAGHYDKIVNECLNKNIEQVMQDNEIWGRL